MKDILVSVASSLEIIGVTSLETTSLLPTNVTHIQHRGKRQNKLLPNLTYGAGDFPTHIKVEFGEYDVKTGKRTPSPYGFDKPLEIPEPYTVNINTATAARLQQVAKANEVKGMTGFFKELVNERNKNGVFDRISDVRLRMSGIAKDSHIENLRLLTMENKLRFI